MVDARPCREANPKAHDRVLGSVRLPQFVYRVPDPSVSRRCGKDEKPSVLLFQSERLKAARFNQERASPSNPRRSGGHGVHQGVERSQNFGSDRHIESRKQRVAQADYARVLCVSVFSGQLPIKGRPRQIRKIVPVHFRGRFRHLLHAGAVCRIRNWIGAGAWDGGHPVLLPRSRKRIDRGADVLQRLARLKYSSELPRSLQVSAQRVDQRGVPREYRVGRSPGRLPPTDRRFGEFHFGD